MDSLKNIAVKEVLCSMTTDNKEDLILELIKSCYEDDDWRYKPFHDRMNTMVHSVGTDKMIEWLAGDYKYDKTHLFAISQMNVFTTDRCTDSPTIKFFVPDGPKDYYGLKWDVQLDDSKTKILNITLWIACGGMYDFELDGYDSYGQFDECPIEEVFINGLLEIHKKAVDEIRSFFDFINGT